ncbi:MAG: tRNA pseudouridine(55) synthase TruB [Gammaproteobacteria bacterium]
MKLSSASLIHGIVLLNKPRGISSNGALGRAKYILRSKKAGHTGSLDPLATGMLPLCFGEATKFSRFLLAADKTYRVTASLGIRTNTGDGEGLVLRESKVTGLSAQDIEIALNGFMGLQQQVPPMFSALKVQGQPLYKLARQGIEIERASREIEIFDIKIHDINLETPNPSVDFTVTCSKGTYIRTLVDDLGERLGCGAVVAQLHRESVAGFELFPMFTIEELATLAEAERQGDAVLPIDAGLTTWPEIQISASSSFYLRQGQSVKVPHQAKDWVRIKTLEGEFIGMGEILENGYLTPRRLLQQAGL